jgi:hypothetical protein
MARVKKAQNGLLMAQEIMAKRKAASKDTTAKYNREDAMKSMSTANKGFDASKDQSRRDSIAKAFEPTRDANMKQMGYSKTKPKGFKLGGKAKDGKSFGMLSVKAGVDKNPKATFADKIAGAKKMAKSGKKLKSGGTVSMQLGSYKGVIGKNTKGKVTKAVGLTKAKRGKSMGKCKNGC